MVLITHGKRDVAVPHGEVAGQQGFRIHLGGGRLVPGQPWNVQSGFAISPLG
jgi:hypothetical protein